MTSRIHVILNSIVRYWERAIDKDSKHAGSVEEVGAFSIHSSLKCWRSILLQVSSALYIFSLREPLCAMASRRPSLPTP